MIDKEIIIRRLAVIKYLYNTGVQQSMQVETVAGFSVLTFHDCAEMFLILVAENKNDKCEKWSFMDFWNNYPELTLRESMRNLKERRISIKHKGQFPSKADIKLYYSIRNRIQKYFCNQLDKIRGCQKVC